MRYAGSEDGAPLVGGSAGESRPMTDRAERKAAGVVFDAAKTTDLVGGRPAADFVYSVRIVDKGADRRSARRRRTRLRSGKILGLDNSFLIECRIYDRSERGVRVRLLGDIPPRPAFRLYEDDRDQLRDARVVWRRDCEIGLCFVPRAGARRISRTQMTCLRERYYAIGD